MQIQPRIASGFPEYLPADQIEFNRMLAIIRNTYESYGFAPVDTPDLELKEVLLAKGGGETDAQVYEFTRGRNDFCLRFDLTVPLARFTAQHENDLVFPFRRYAIGKVHRAERAQAGRFREFYQCDIDIIGSNSSVVDAEFPVIINEIFDRFNFGDFVIRINDRRVLNGFFESIGLTGREAEILRLVDKMEKMSATEFRKLLAAAELSDEQIAKIEQFTAISGTNDEILAQLGQLTISNENFAAGLANLKNLVTNLRAFDMQEQRFAIDLKIARGLDYYTGTVYETILTDYPELGSVCSGGRYDNLAEFYTDTKLPGVGISIGLTRLFYKLREIGVIKSKQKSPADVVILPMSENEYLLAIEASRRLREAGVANVLYTEQNPLKKKLRFADQMGFGWALIIGNNEAESGAVTVKNMITGENQLIKLDDLVATLSVN